MENGVAAIAAGGSHTCALTTDGAVKCWGHNASGQLGDGSTTTRLIPVPVSGLASGVAAITAGSGHTCALTTGGGIKCWGSNMYGQLGISMMFESSTIPVQVGYMWSGVTTVSAGAGHTCALTLEGGAKCWGNNWYGQIGDGTTTNQSTPVDVIGLGSGVGSILAGSTHTCALTTNGEAQCWGSNWYGQLGDGTLIDRSTPAAVIGLDSGLVTISLGDYHTCGLTVYGRVKCWGSNEFGALGNGRMPKNRNEPVPVSGLVSGVSAIDAGSKHNCVLTAVGAVHCWGGNNRGQLGDGTIGNNSSPVAVSELGSGVAAISAGWFHTCGLTTGGGVKCWGSNEFGQLGDGTKIDRHTSIDVFGLNSGVVAIAAGHGHSCALSTDGGVMCWGTNLSGQLGDGTTIESSTPVAVSGLESGVAVIAAGVAHTCALTTGGGVMCWGNNWYGELGDGTYTNRSTPVAVNGLESGVASLAAGEYHTCALITNGEVMCWGYNQYGQLGDGTTTNGSIPVAISVLNGEVTAISAGGDHTCVLTTSGGAKCWGANRYGQLGDGTYTDRSTPVTVKGLGSGVVSLAAGEYHTCALTTDGGVRCWGGNWDGQLGDGANLWSSTPVDVLTPLTFFLPLIFRY